MAMRRIGTLLMGVLVFSIAAQAQGPAGAGAGDGTHGSSRDSSFSRSDFTPWQLAIGYQYNRINLVGIPFNTNGANVTITRFFGRWFGLDAQAGAGFFGNTGTSTTPPDLGVHSLFVGGGPRLAYRNHSRIEPWIHAVVGLEDFRFTQTSGVLGSNHALGGAGGGGMDYIIGPHLALRAEADVMQTRFFSAYQRHFQGVGGLVFNF